MKKTISALLVCVFLFALAIPAFAGSINAEEQRLINYVKEKYTYTITDTILGKAENALKNDKLDLTKAQVDQIIAILDEALAYCKANNLDSYEDDVAGNMEVQDKLLGYADRALKIAGLGAKTDRAADTVTIYWLDSGETLDSFNPAIIAHTGSDTTAAGLAFAAFALVACAGAFGVKRFRKEDDEA